MITKLRCRKARFLAYLIILSFLFALALLNPLGSEKSLAGPTVSLYSKLGSTAEITSPETGPGGTVNGSPTFETGKDGNGILLDENTEWVEFPGDGTIDSNGDGYIDDEGMVSFWYKPSRDMDAGEGTLLNTASKYAGIELDHTVTQMRVYFRYNAGNFTLTTDPMSWSAGDWLHFRLWWDNNDATDNVKLWINGNDVLSTHDGTFVWQYAYAYWFCIGNNREHNRTDQGVYDDLRVFQALDSTPVIDSLSDSSVYPGQQITIHGSDFGVNDDEQGEVSFNGIAATIDSWSDTAIEVTVPNGISDGQVTVTTYIDTSNGANYTVAPSISGAYYASTQDILLIQGSVFGDTQGVSKVYADGVDLGAADWWDTNRIYYQNISNKPTLVRVEVGGEELTSSVTNLSLYSPYPYDSDTSEASLVSYWPFDSNWEDAKGSNDGTNLGTTLRPEAIFGKALQPSQLIGFEDNRYISFGSLLELANGDIIDVYRNAEGHLYTESKIEIRRSTDDGYDWSEPTTIVDNIGYDDRFDGGAIIQLANNEILFLYARVRLSDEETRVVVMASSDNGYTWTERDVIEGAELPPMTAVGRSYGPPVQLENGRIIAELGGSHPDCQEGTITSFYSDDNGVTWHFQSIIGCAPTYAAAPSTTAPGAVSAGATEIPVADVSSFPDAGMMHITDGINEEHFTYGYKDGNTLKNIYDSTLSISSGIQNDYNAGATVKWYLKKLDETQIIKAPDENNLMAVTRHNGFGTAPGNRMLYSFSTDKGENWTQPSVLYFNSQTGTPIGGQGFRLHTASSNRIYLVYRWNGTKLAYSDDNGVTWTGDNTGSALDSSNYYINNNSGAYASFAEESDRLMIQSYREYNGGSDAYIEKAYIYKDHPDQVGNYLWVPAAASLQLEQFSVEFWIRNDTHYENSSFGTNQIILAKRDASQDSLNNCNYIFKLLDPTGADADKVEFGLYDSTNSYQSIKSDLALETGQWYHIAGTYNGSTMRFYVDGMLQDDFGTDLTTLESSPLTVGIYSVNRDWYANYQKFQGQIDNLKIWDRAVSDDTILGNANYSAPSISSISPSRADRGTTITISGSNFGDSQNDSIVTISGTSMAVSSWSGTSIRATVPTGISKGAKSIVVTVNGNQSNSKSFIVGQPPTISKVEARNIQQTRAKISWQTNELASSRVDYGRSSSLGKGSSSSSKTTSHKRLLTGLLPGTRYYYRVSSTDSDGNKASSAIKSFTTLEVEGIAYYQWWSGLGYSQVELTIVDIFDRQRSKRISIKKKGKEYLIYDQRPIFRGEAPPNAELKIVIRSKKLVGYTQADSYGKWQYQPEEELEFGRHRIKVVVLTGQLKGYSESLSFLIKNPEESDQAEEEEEKEKREEEERTAASARSVFWYFLGLAIVVATGILLIYRWYRAK